MTLLAWPGVRPDRTRRRGPWNLDGSPANIRASVEGSLKRLGTDYIDLKHPAVG
jgi:aryl-alcohol dehydrogenase-like predicted oxidoreductase